MKKIKYVIIAIFSMFLATFDASAMSYTPNVNLFEGTYSNNLVDMAMSQIDNFINKNFVVFQVDNNYYLVTGDDHLVSGTTITFTNSTIFSAVRYTSGGYNSYYEYSTYTESSTVIYANYTVISNIDSPKSISSKRFKEYWSESYSVLILTVILGLCFAIFLTKGRSYL